jgi:hypothetical protein
MCVCCTHLGVGVVVRSFLVWIGLAEMYSFLLSHHLLPEISFSSQFLLTLLFWDDIFCVFQTQRG